MLISGTCLRPHMMSLVSLLVYVNKETGFRLVMMHYPKFPDFKALNVQFMSVPLPKAFTVET